VDINGDVLLTWAVPPDPNGDFAEYVLYASNSALGPFLQFASVPVYIQDSFLHLGAAAHVAPKFYYITTRSVDPPPNESITSDTLATMFLTVSQSTPLGSADLLWTLQHQPLLSSAAGEIVVELEYPIGTWTQVLTLDSTDTSFEQEISTCGDSLTYRVSVQNLYGCTSYSNLSGDVFDDVTAPTPPVLVNLTVDTATNQTSIDWDQSPEGDTDGYIVILVTEGGNIILDTLYGAGNTNWVWPGSDAGSGVESYAIAAFDTCITGTPGAPNTSATESVHSTVFLSSSYNQCGSTINVLWTSYIGWAVLSYELYVRINNGPLVLLGSFAPTDTSFVHENLVPFSTYCYVVKAIGAGALQVSLSNQHCRTTSYPALPQWNYLRSVSVVAQDHIVIVDSVDGSASVGGYRLERTFNGEPWEVIASQPPTLAPTVVFSDLDVDTDLRGYTYRVVVVDSCGLDAVTSNEGTSLLLVTEAGIDGVNHLRWNGYEDWAGAVTGYTVYRSIGDQAFFPIAVNPPGQWELDDDVSALYPSNGKFCYFVEAHEGGNASGLNAISTSNVACAIQHEALWIPNAFIAGHPSHGSFLPVPAFVDVNGFEMVIFNRWGQAIWATADRSIGWDGKIDGSYVPQGVYAYYCAFHNGAGKKFEERGSVTFLCCPE
jgi:CHU_C Type IX secretion signal domain